MVMADWQIHFQHFEIGVVGVPVGAGAGAIVDVVERAIRSHQIHLQITLVGVDDAHRHLQIGWRIAGPPTHRDRRVDGRVVVDRVVAGVLEERRLRAATTTTAGGVAAGQADTGEGRVSAQHHVIGAGLWGGEAAGLIVAIQVRPAVVSAGAWLAAEADVQICITTAASP